ncbi:MAG: pilus assembly protein PilP [Burkholderiales bacterium]|jgi:type IV pilus assembly protein PilP
MILSPFSFLPIRQNATGRLRRPFSLGLVAVVAACLQGCDSGHADLQSWMDETRRNTPIRIDTVEEPKRFEPFRYQADKAADPFAMTRLRAMASAAASAGSPASANAGVRPNDKRVREPLEAFPLDLFRMVGSLRRGREQIGLLRAENQLHQIRVGQYIGQNHGRVVQISDERILIREIVEDAAGEWTQRDTEMRLQESAS